MYCQLCAVTILAATATALVCVDVCVAKTAIFYSLVSRSGVACEDILLSGLDCQAFNSLSRALTVDDIVTNLFILFLDKV